MTQSFVDLDYYSVYEGLSNAVFSESQLRELSALLSEKLEDLSRTRKRAEGGGDHPNLRAPIEAYLS